MRLNQKACCDPPRLSSSVSNCSRFMLVGSVDHFRLQPIQADVPLVSSEPHERLAMFEVKHIVGLDPLVGRVLEDAVIEDLAILVDLDERGPLVGGGSLQGCRSDA